MLSDFSDKQLQWLSNENITFHNHGRGITLHVFENRPELNQFYRAIATSKDRNGTEFLSVMEGEDNDILAKESGFFLKCYPFWLCLAKDYPFYGVQWHPEKSAFEWDETEDICHSEHAIIIMQMAANFFVGEGDYGRA